MEIIDYDVSQVIWLMNVFRPQGAPYAPEIAAKVVARYQFAKPPTLDDLGGSNLKFQIGKFNDVQITEFGVYNDGVTVTGKCPTEILEGFVNDVLAFSEQELKFVPILEERNELHFESKLLVKCDADLGAFLAPAATNPVQKALHDKLGVHFRPSGFVMDCDIAAIKSRRKPARFFIERRVGFKFEDNLFHCIAPLRTKDHLDLLSALERQVLEQTKGR
jgi:hypothetical protein